MSASGEHLLHSGGKPPPFLLLFRNPRASRPREAVEPGAASLIREAPLGLHESPLLETIERGIERALPNALRDPPAVERCEEEALQNEQVESALQKIGAFGHGYLELRQEYAVCCRRSRHR